MSDQETFESSVKELRDSSKTIRVRKRSRSSGVPLDSGCSYTDIGLVTVNGSWVDVGTVAVTPTNCFKVSGTVEDNTSAAVPGASIVATGDSSSSDTTDSSGDYDLFGIFPGDVSIAASCDGYYPATADVTVTNADVTKDLTMPQVVVSGTISDGGVGLDGVTVGMTGESDTTTASGGLFSFSPVIDGDKTITPTKSGYTFEPATLDISVARESITGNDFEANPSAVTTDITASAVGCCRNIASWATCRDATSASNLRTDSAYVGQLASTMSTDRSFFTFSIPAASAINACNLMLFGETVAPTANFEIYLHTSTQHSPFVQDDFDQFDGWVSGSAHTGTILNSTFDTASNYTNGAWNTISLNAAGLSAVLAAQGGTLKICMISKQDYNRVQPTTNEKIGFASMLDTDKPYIHLTYVP